MSSLALALAAGVATVAAPCILPVLPIVLGSSIGQRDSLRPLLIVAGFIVSFSAVALLFSASSEALALPADTLRQTAVVLLGLFGVLMLWRWPLDQLMQRFGAVFDAANALGQRAGQGHAGAVLLGVTLGVVWTPCAGPVLGAILTLIATESDARQTGPLLLAYAFGAGLPMLAIAYGGQIASTRVRQLARYSRRLQQLFGMLILLTAIAMQGQYDLQLALWLSGSQGL
jgi:cytochrome c biogenesis protein CcdA